jgi:Domain of unknown function (DUF5753)
VYIESHLGGQFVTDGESVREYALSYDLIRGAAMSADESLRSLRTKLESI